MRHQSIQPKLSFKLSSLKQEFIDIYNRTWCTNNFNATIVNGKYKWISLNARLPGSPALVPPRLQFPPWAGALLGWWSTQLAGVGAAAANFLVGFIWALAFLIQQNSAGGLMAMVLAAGNSKNGN